MGINAANNLIYLLVSFLLASMLVSGMASQHNLKNLDVNVIFPSEIFAETPFIAMLEIVNRRKRFPAFFIKLKLLDQSVFVMFLKARESRRFMLKVSLPGRGLYEEFSVQVMSRFPFNFFSRSFTLEFKQKIIAYPKPLKCGYFEIDSIDRNDEHRIGEINIPSYGWLEDEIVYIRDYREGDPKKSINWKATARTGDLKVNERLPEVPRIMVIDLDGPSGVDLETVLSCATYAVIKYAEEGYLVGLKGKTLSVPPGAGAAHLKNILEILALYDLYNKVT